MPKSDKQKLKLLYLKEIFERNTNETHGITMENILEELQRQGIKAERKSIYSDLFYLEEYGMEIQHAAGKDKTYRLLERDKDSLEVPEIKLLIDSIQSSKFLSEAKTNKLISKLEKQCSRYDAQNLQRQVIVTNRVKTMNQSVFINVSNIHEAIAANRQISFKYFKHKSDKSIEYMGGRHEFVYTASPYALIYSDDNYYLLAYESGKFKHFRVDRMKEINSDGMPEREAKEEFKGINLAEYSKYTFGMYGGKAQKVTMVFHESLIDPVLDRFGHEIQTTRVDKDHFRITVTVAVSQQFFGWLFGLGERAEIIEPIEVREKYRESIETLLGKYV